VRADTSRGVGSEVVPAAPAVLVTSHNPHMLRALLAAERDRGAMSVRTPVSEIRPGVWGAWVVQLKPMRRPWVRPVAAAGGAIVAASMCWWLVEAVTAVLAAVSVAGVIGAAVLGLLLARLVRPSSGHGCETTVIVRHRH
jgi:hypothetical protein